MVKTLSFVALILTAIAMSLAMAHLFELPNKIEISAAHYLIVQRNYDNWAVIGLIVPAAFLSVIALTIALRGSGAPFTLALIALLLLVGELVAFWGFIFPVNQATQNWTALPRQLGDTAQPMGICPRGPRHPLRAGLGYSPNVGPRLALRRRRARAPLSKIRSARSTRSGKSVLLEAASRLLWPGAILVALSEEWFVV
jgi:hypothetical protein